MKEVEPEFGKLILKRLGLHRSRAWRMLLPDEKKRAKKRETKPTMAAWEGLRLPSPTLITTPSPVRVSLNLS